MNFPDPHAPPCLVVWTAADVKKTDVCGHGENRGVRVRNPF